MATDSHTDLIKEIEDQFSKNVTTDAKFTILTIRNLIKSNSLVEDSIDELHTSINNANKQNEKLQRRVYYLTIVTVILTLVQAFAVIKELIK